MDLATLLRDPTTTIEQVREGLDALDHPGRVSAIQACDRPELLRLWALSAGAPPITEAHFVTDRPAGVPTIHDGWNSLPLPRAGRRFQKIFSRPPPGGPPRLFGFNEGDSRSLIGPGYFQLVPTTETPAWAERGAWVVDYFKVPDAAVPEGWPKVVPNWWGIQVFVYNGTRDFMRGVSAHVSIGKPWARALELPFCFALVRQD